MIDLHSHILPGIDDGPATMEESVRHAVQAVRDGVTTVVATPHHANGVWDTNSPLIAERCSALAAELHKRHVPLRILPGAEVHMTPDILKKTSHGDIIALGETYRLLLLELPDLFIRDGVMLVIRTLLDAGITPVIAHPERNRELIANPGFIATLVGAGALMQITAGSLFNDFGPQARRCAEDMLACDLVHFAGSDWHPGRKSRMGKIHKKLSKRVGPEKAEKILYTNAHRALFVDGALKPAGGDGLAG